MDFVIQKTERKLKLLKRNTNVSSKYSLQYSVKYIHNQKLKYFSQLQTKVLQEKTRELNKLQKSQNYDSKTEERLNKEIKRIKDREEENDYYLKTAQILNRYFEVELDAEVDKLDIIREYYDVLGLQLPLELKDLCIDNDSCKYCGGDLDTVSYEDGFSCRDCGVVSIYNLSDVASYREIHTTDITPVLDYKRVNYFKEWLNQIQAKEQTEIPQSVIDTVILELKKERIKNISSISNSLMKRLLKKTGNSKYYEHSSYIINIISKVTPISIPEPVEKKLIAMFHEIQKPWEKLKTKYRKNFLSYPYTIHKFCQILNIKEYLPYFPLLKSREKLYKQDILWKKIVEDIIENPSKNEVISDVEWRFIPSV